MDLPVGITWNQVEQEAELLHAALEAQVASTSPKHVMRQVFDANHFLVLEACYLKWSGTPRVVAASPSPAKSEPATAVASSGEEPTKTDQDAKLSTAQVQATAEVASPSDATDALFEMLLGSEAAGVMSNLVRRMSQDKENDFAASLEEAIGALFDGGAADDVAAAQGDPVVPELPAPLTMPGSTEAQATDIEQQQMPLEASVGETEAHMEASASHLEELERTKAAMEARLAQLRAQLREAESEKEEAVVAAAAAEAQHGRPDGEHHAEVPLAIQPGMQEEHLAGPSLWFHAADLLVQRSLARSTVILVAICAGLIAALRRHRASQQLEFVWV